ncbi:MAG: T9SS type A sorting domain-containing protein [Bacteroidia bacterium]|nr:T9SS type A sorting domain-containing protein [Bacteroidia bacterium]
MKKIFSSFIFISFLFQALLTFSQADTLILTPGPADGKDVTMRTDHPNTNYGIDMDFIANAWTAQGNFFIQRSLIQFDLTPIPDSAIVIEATLSLFTNLNSGHYQLDSGQNASYFLRILEPWSEFDVTWNSQPQANMNNPVIVPESISNTQDYILDVTAHTQEMVSIPDSNFGWLFRLQIETTYRALVFASSDNAVLEWRPKLTVTFIDTCNLPAAGPISGPSSLCQGDSGIIYTTPPIPYVTIYSWSLPPGALITAGANTNEITVQFSQNANSGEISVFGISSCSTGLPSQPLSVSVNPRPVPTITGVENLCVNSGYYYYSTEPNMLNYQWNISSGGIINWEADSNVIRVSWILPGDQWVSVNYFNENGCSAVEPVIFNVNVNPVPSPAGNIDGPQTVCPGDSDVPFSIDPIANALTYVWFLPPGASIISGLLTNSIIVNFENTATSGDILVYGNNLCGNGLSSDPFPVTVHNTPPAPVIEQHSDTLISNAPYGNQWYLNDVPIAEATSSIYIAILEGDYYDIVTLNECSSNPSNVLHVVLTSSEIEKAVYSFDIFPNPNPGKFTIILPAHAEQIFDLRIVDITGKIVYLEKAISSAVECRKEIHLGNIPEGIYSIILQNCKQILSRTIVVTK